MTNSKKIKRNIGASRRLAPFGHVRSITFIIMLLTVALIFGCRKSSTSPNPTVFTVEAGTSSPIRIIKDTDYKAYSDGNIGAKVGGTSDYSVTITKVEQKDTAVDVVLDASDFTVDKNTIKLSEEADKGINKFSGKNLTEKKAKEYTLTLTYSTTANVEPKSREITTDIGIVQNHILTKDEFTTYVKKWKWQANSTAQANAGNIYVNSSDGNSSVQFQVNSANFSATDKTRNYSISGNGSGVAYSKANALNIFASAAKKDDSQNPTSTGYESYFSDIKGLKTVDSDSLNKMTLYLQFILNDDTALIDTELTHITNANEGLSFELSLGTQNDTWGD